MKRRILSHVADRRYEPRQIRQLAHELGILPEQHQDFHDSVHELIEQRQVVLGAADTVVLPPPGRTVIGTFRPARGGFGFVMPEAGAGHADVNVLRLELTVLRGGKRLSITVDSTKFAEETRRGGILQPTSN